VHNLTKNLNRKNKKPSDVLHNWVFDKNFLSYTKVIGPQKN